MKLAMTRADLPGVVGVLLFYGALAWMDWRLLIVMAGHPLINYHGRRHRAAQAVQAPVPVHQDPHRTPPRRK